MNLHSNPELRSFISSQINRLGGLNKPPRGNEAMADYAAALAKADTTDIIIDTIDDFVFQATDCPKIADLLAVIYRKNEARREESPTKKPTGCKLCNYTGFVVTYWLLTTERFKTKRERVPQIVDLVSEILYKAELATHQRPEGSPRQEVLSAVEPCTCRKEKAS